VVVVALEISPRWSALTYPLVAVMATLSLGFCWSVRTTEQVTAVVRFDGGPAGACVEDPFRSSVCAALRVGAELSFTPLGSTQVEVLVVDRVENAADVRTLCVRRLKLPESPAGLAGTLSCTLGRERLLYRLFPQLKALLGG
jgi:hypothetical protein